MERSVEKRLREEEKKLEKRIKLYHIRKTFVIRFLKIRFWINVYKFKKNFEIQIGIKRGFE